MLAIKDSDFIISPSQTTGRKEYRSFPAGLALNTVKGYDCREYEFGLNERISDIKDSDSKCSIYFQACFSEYVEDCGDFNSVKVKQHWEDVPGKKINLPKEIMPLELLRLDGDITAEPKQDVQLNVHLSGHTFNRIYGMNSNLPSFGFGAVVAALISLDDVFPLSRHPILNRHLAHLKAKKKYWSEQTSFETEPIETFLKDESILKDMLEFHKVGDAGLVNNVCSSVDLPVLKIVDDISPGLDCFAIDLSEKSEFEKKALKIKTRIVSQSGIFDIASLICLKRDHYYAVVFFKDRFVLVDGDAANIFYDGFTPFSVYHKSLKELSFIQNTRFYKGPVYFFDLDSVLGMCCSNPNFVFYKRIKYAD